MGDPKKTRKKYETPRHPWVGARITEERELRKEYGLSTKKEIWKAGSTLAGFKDRAKKLLALTGSQADKEREQMLARMTRLGLIKQGATFDDILGLGVRDLLNRRLQSILVKKHLARTLRQARQMIIHRHIALSDKVVTSPSYLVGIDEEASISFVSRSAFTNQQHPERFSEEELKVKQQREASAKEKKEEKEEESILIFDEKEIEQAEVLAGEKKVESIAVETKESQASEKKVEEKPVEKKAETPTPEKKEAPAKEAEKSVEKVEKKPEEKKGGAE